MKTPSEQRPTVKIPAFAANTKTGMTVEELEELLQRARDAGATGREPVQVTTAGMLTVRIKTAVVTVVSPRTGI